LALLYAPATAGKRALREVMHLPDQLPHHSVRDITTSWKKVVARLEKAVKVLLLQNTVLKAVRGNTSLCP